MRGLPQERDMLYLMEDSFTTGKNFSPQGSRFCLRNIKFNSLNEGVTSRENIVLLIKSAFYLRKVDFYTRNVNFTSQNRVLSHERTCRIFERGILPPERGVFPNEGRVYPRQVGFYLRRDKFYLTKTHFSPHGGGLSLRTRTRSGGSQRRFPRSHRPRPPPARPLVEPAANGEAAARAPPRGCAGTFGGGRRTPKS